MVLDAWTPIPSSYIEVLRRASQHPDGMTLAGKRTAQLLEKRGYAENLGAARRSKAGKLEVIICITDLGERVASSGQDQTGNGR